MPFWNLLPKLPHRRKINQKTAPPDKELSPSTLVAQEE
jgi:hypothetical protein